MSQATAPIPGEGFEGAVLELTVGPIAHGGHCVARDEGRVVFVRHTLPGETVRAVVTEERKGFLRADAIEVLVPSPHRVVPPCPFAGPDRCGGCDFQHADLEYQRTLKTDVLHEQLIRMGGLDPTEVTALRVTVQGLPSVPGEPDGQGWRTRVQYTVDSTGRAGLLKHRSHEVVPIDRCLIAHSAVRDCDALDVQWPDLDAVEVVAGSVGEPAVLGRKGRGAATRVAGPSRVRERGVGRDWLLPAHAFWQVHPAAADTLAATVAELLQPSAGDRVWDLYGGVGLFAAVLAQSGASQRGTSEERTDRAGRDTAQSGASQRGTSEERTDRAGRDTAQSGASQRGTSEERTDRAGRDTAQSGASQRGTSEERTDRAGRDTAPATDASGRITVVEGSPVAAAAAAENLRDLTTVTVVHAEVAHALANSRWRAVDLVVLDPPRAGAGRDVVAAIAARSPRAVAYVACDPATLARDVRAFREHGYGLTELRAYDIFPHTHHFECVALLTPGTLGRRPHSPG